MDCFFLFCSKISEEEKEKKKKSTKKFLGVLAVRGSKKRRIMSMSPAVLDGENEGDGKLIILQRLRERNAREMRGFSSGVFMAMREQDLKRRQQREAELREKYELELEMARFEGGGSSSKNDSVVEQLREENAKLRDDLSQAYRQSYKETTEVARAFSLLEEEKEKMKELEHDMELWKEQKKILEEIVKEKEGEWREKMGTIAAMKKEMEAKQAVIGRLEKRLIEAQTQKEEAEIAKWALEREVKAKEEEAEKKAKEAAIEKKTMEFETKRWSDLTNKLMGMLEGLFSIFSLPHSFLLDSNQILLFFSVLF